MDVFPVVKAAQVDKLPVGYSYPLPVVVCKLVKGHLCQVWDLGVSWEKLLHFRKVFVVSFSHFRFPAFLRGFRRLG